MGSKTANIQKRRRLQLLFERGKLVHFDESGAVTDKADKKGMSVWVGPPNPLQREQAIREAQAARSRAILAARSNSDESEANATKALLGGLTDEGVIDYLIVMDEQTRLGESRRRVLAEKEWEDFNALRDSMRQWEEAGFPDTEEWKPLLERDTAFGEQVTVIADGLRSSDSEALQLVGRAEVERRIIERTVERVGSQAFMTGYDQWMLFYGVRDDEDHQELFFEKPDELFSLPEAAQSAIREAYEEFVTEAGEAKNSPRVASGSDSSAPPAEPETSEASGLVESSV